MKSSFDRTPPDEPEIEDLLSQFKPWPSPRFFHLMRLAPWKNTPVKKIASRPESLSEQRVIWSLVTLIVIFMGGAILFIPPIRAAASQIFHSFINAPSNQIQVQVLLTNPDDMYSVSNPSNYSLSISEVQQKASFPVKQISPIPEGFDLAGARYDPSYNTVILLYQDSDDYLTLWLTQRPVGNSQDVFSIGQEAVVKLVKIGDVQGEFVQGGWQARSTQPAGSTINIVADWNNDLPQSTLRWQAGGVVYELRASGYGGPSQTDLINWANELK